VPRYATATTVACAGTEVPLKSSSVYGVLSLLASREVDDEETAASDAGLTAADASKATEAPPAGNSPAHAETVAVNRLDLRVR
jgi:hypothetical protein